MVACVVQNPTRELTQLCESHEKRGPDGLGEVALAQQDGGGLHLAGNDGEGVPTANQVVHPAQVLMRVRTRCTRAEPM